MFYEVREQRVKDRDQSPSGNRVSVCEAAEILGVTVDATRKRIQRGTIPYERGDGRVWVQLEAAGMIPDEGQREYRSASDEFIDELREQVRHLRKMLDEERDARRRADMIIAQLARTNAALAGRVPSWIVSPTTQSSPLPSRRQSLRTIQRSTRSLDGGGYLKDGGRNCRGAHSFGCARQDSMVLF
jgi:hypothetical protein